jgi:sterol desaturase/sphingolipid hydroxylase (fatty acid hydroxylase superfamily)
VLEWIVARSMFPLVLGGAVFWSISRIESGADPGLAVAAPTILAYVVIAATERLLYWDPEWLHSRGDLRVDVGHLLVSGLLTTRLLDLPARLLAIALGARLAGAVGFSIWPSEWSLWAQLLLALVFGEFFMYWVHRLSHEVDWLWRFHAMHHSAPRLYFLNAVRFHPVDIALSTFSPMIPLIVIGADGRVIALFGLVSAVHGLFQHANIVLKLGPLNWFFSMAELHRWHHSRLLEESNTNFGQNLIVWDVVFGTRFLPADREPPSDIGIAGLPAFPMDYWGQLMSPLRWQRIKSESAALEAGSATLSADPRWRR